jgi:RND family efflux transporter MFP subunit
MDGTSYSITEGRDHSTEAEQDDAVSTGDRDVSQPVKKGRMKMLLSSVAVLAVVAAGAVGATYFGAPAVQQAAATPTPPSVDVSAPLERKIEPRLQFLGQFSAVDKVELRAQVGGTLIEIGFKDGDIVHKGDLLFSIDPVPYQIALNRGQAQLETAQAQLVFANQEMVRAKTLSVTGAGTLQKVDQRAEEVRSAQAAIDDAQAAIRDAKFDLDHTKIYAPFTGRIGSHLVSVGNLIAGSRAATSPTTLLATIVSTDNIYLNIDMSESDYQTFQREHAKQGGILADKVQISLNDTEGFTREGTLDFVDNTLDRSSGTIHVRATVPNKDLMLTPGGFARVRLALAEPAPALLVPDASVLPDQTDHMVLTVGKDGVVTPKKVVVGDLRGGLRVIQSGLEPTDQVVISGIPTAHPGSKVSPNAGSIKFQTAQD